MKIFPRVIGYVILGMALVSCGRKEVKHEPKDTTSDVAVKLGTYVKASESHVNGYGFDVDSACDSLQRSCFRLLGGASVDYAQAEDPAEPGRWYRDSGRSCGPGAGTSKSGVSQDTLLGLALCLWQQADVGRARDTLAYGDAHGGTMSPDGPEELTAFGHVLPHLFKAIVAKAEGTPLPVERPVPDNSGLTSILNGYQAHLAVVGVMLDGLIYGGLTPIEMQLVKDQVTRQPRNALYQAVLHRFTDRDQSKALSILNDETLFPADRLPSEKDRSSSYLWERDAPSGDWSPGSGDAVFTGTDFIFAASLVTNRIRGG